MSAEEGGSSDDDNGDDNDEDDDEDDDEVVEVLEVVVDSGARLLPSGVWYMGDESGTIRTEPFSS